MKVSRPKKKNVPNYLGSDGGFITSINRWWLHPMCLLAGGFHFTTWSPSDLVTLWQVNGTNDKAAPIPLEANVAWSEWTRVEGRRIAFEPKKTIYPLPSTLFLPVSLCTSPLTCLSFLSVGVLFFWVWSSLTWGRVKSVKVKWSLFRGTWRKCVSQLTGLISSGFREKM